MEKGSKIKSECALEPKRTVSSQKRQFQNDAWLLLPDLRIWVAQNSKIVARSTHVATNKQTRGQKQTARAADRSVSETVTATVVAVF